LTVETKLARWRALYGELCDAEQRLRQAQAGRRTGGPATGPLELELRALKQRCDSALDEVGAALAASHSAPAKSDAGPASYRA